MKCLQALALASLFMLPGYRIFSQSKAVAFTVIPLGVKGGSDESNLSSYLVAPKGSDDFICLDAGTLHTGIQKCIDKGLLKGSATQFLRQNIKGYLISHPHLDHLAGLILNSPDDSSKNIYALPFCVEVLKTKYFSWASWANFGDDGEKPQLNKYHYVLPQEGITLPIENTTLSLSAYTLSHSAPYKSTAFLIGSKENFLLYLGDTGADSVEHSNQLGKLWDIITPLIQQKKLRAIFIETSFDNSQSSNSLFGHLTPALLMQEMNELAKRTGKQALKQVAIVITHEKPGGRREQKIKQQLKAENSLGLRLVFPQQAAALSF